MMTKEEAIKELKEHIAICMYTLKDTDKHLESEGIAIEALEKQIPQKLLPSSGTYKQLRGPLYPLQCPRCKRGYKLNVYSPYCKYCGQALDWSEND